MKKSLSFLLTLALLMSLLAVPMGASAFTGTDRNEYPLSPKTKEAVELGLVNLDGTLPIIPDPEAFEAKYGKISVLIVNNAERVVPVGDLVEIYNNRSQDGSLLATSDRAVASHQRVADAFQAMGVLEGGADVRPLWDKTFNRYLGVQA